MEDWIIRGVVTFLFGILAWVIRRSYTRMDNIDKKVTDNIDALSKDICTVKGKVSSLALKVATDYLSKREFDKFESRLFKELDSLHSDVKQLIAEKADKK